MTMLPVSQTATPDGVLPFQRGWSAWLWKISQIRSWRETFTAARDLGFVGLHLHSDGLSLRKVLTREVRDMAGDYGLDLGVSIAFDTGSTDSLGNFTGTPKEVLLGHILRLGELLQGPGTIGLNWEMKWENDGRNPPRWHHRREDAAWIASKAVDGLAGSGVLLWDAPWWKPSVHGSAPTDEFGRGMAARVTQNYYVYTETDPDTHKPVDRLIGVPADFAAKHPGKPATPPSVMVETTRHDYAMRPADARKPLAFGFQATSGGTARGDRYIGQCLRDYPVTMWWHFLRLAEPDNVSARALFRAAKLIRDYSPGLAYPDAVRAFQQETGLPVDGWVGSAVVAKARETFGTALAGY